MKSDCLIFSGTKVFMVVIPLFNGMLSDGLMVRSMDVMSKMMLGESSAGSMKPLFHSILLELVVNIILWPELFIYPSATPAATICISPTSIPPVPLVVALRVNISVKL